MIKKILAGLAVLALAVNTLYDVVKKFESTTTEVVQQKAVDTVVNAVKNKA